MRALKNGLCSQSCPRRRRLLRRSLCPRRSIRRIRGPFTRRIRRLGPRRSPRQFKSPRRLRARADAVADQTAPPFTSRSPAKIPPRAEGRGRATHGGCGLDRATQCVVSDGERPIRAARCLSAGNARARWRPPRDRRHPRRRAGGDLIRMRTACGWPRPSCNNGYAVVAPDYVLSATGQAHVAAKLRRRPGRRALGA